MNFGKSIRLFLIEGVPDGRWVCELSNWTGKAYKIPRTYIKDSLDRKDLEYTGIYFLFGKDDESNDYLVYIGEAENVFERLNQHLLSKEFWTEAVVFISKDNNLNKAHIKYLEHRLYEIAKKADRYQILNSNTPTDASLSEADCAEMEEFIENTKLLLSALGHKLLEPIIDTSLSIQNENYFYIQATRGASAKGKLVSDGFVVTKGSKMANSTVSSLRQTVVDLREQLIKNGIVDGTFMFQKDHIFSSPSLAAEIILGRSANGRIEWKDKNRIQLKNKEEI